MRNQTYVAGYLRIVPDIACWYTCTL